MKNRSSMLAILLLAQLGELQISSAAFSTPPPDAKETGLVTCAFSNPRYSGWCRVTQDLPDGVPAKKICRSVLTCLNDVRCTKTYCNATEIRGGWKLESVDGGPKKQ